MPIVKVAPVASEITPESKTFVRCEVGDISYAAAPAAKVGPGPDAVVGVLTIVVPVTRAAIASRSKAGGAAFGFGVTLDNTGGKRETLLIEGLGTCSMFSGAVSAVKGTTFHGPGEAAAAPAPTRKGGKGA